MSERRRIFSSPFPEIAGLALLALLPLALGATLRSPVEPLLRGRGRRIGALELEGVRLDLPGPDGTTVRLRCDTLRTEAADTGRIVSATKALVARGVSIRPAEAEHPEWRFARVQLRRRAGPYDWFGPARLVLASGEERELRSFRGTFTVAEGALRSAAFSEDQ